MSPRPLLLNGESLRQDLELQRRGGGSEKYEPRTAEEAREILLPQIETARAAATGLPERLRGERIIVETTLLPNYLAASYHPSNLLGFVDATSIGSRHAEGPYEIKSRTTQSATRRLILAMTDGGLEQLLSLATNRGRTRSGQRAFEDLRTLNDFSLPERDSILTTQDFGEGEAVTVECVLHPAGLNAIGEPTPAGDDIIQKWVALVESLAGTAHLDFIRTIGGLSFAPAQIHPAYARELASFNPLRTVRPMPSIRPFPAIGPRGVAPRVHPPARLSPVDPDLAIAVFDGGLDNSASPPFFPFDETTLATDKPDPGAVRHGTAVTAAATFGLMVPGSQLPQPLARLDHYRIHPPDGWPSDLSVVWVLDEIERVTGNEDYTIVNLSYGPDQAVEADNEPDRWTVLLDQVAYERDVLFVVAAGNNGQAPDHLGLNRVQVPADGANVLSVGACDRPDADPWAKAPYSAVGPGRPGARIQPTGVQFGGVLDNNPFLAMTPDGRLADEQGTSFAAPIVTHALTGLAVRLGAHVRPALLRALAVHYARPHRHHHKHRRELGYGRFPLSFDDVLDCDPGEVSLVYQDTIGRNEIIAYSIPIPGGATGALKIAATLAVTSAVEPSQVTEYTRAAVELTLRPHAHRYAFTRRDPNRSEEALLTDRIRVADLMADGYSQSYEPVTARGFKRHAEPEGLARDNGKWETLRTYRCKLSPSDVLEPRLDVSYVARRAGALAWPSDPVDFALVITITEDGSTDLYDRVTTAFPNLIEITAPHARIQT